METKAKTSKMLKEEHKNILKVIEKLEREISQLKKGRDIKREFWEKSIEFIRMYADRFHHAKEEDILFKEMNKNEGELHCNPVQQMLYEHDLGRKAVKEMEEGIQKRDKEKIISGAIKYTTLLKEHIFKEDNILYPIAEEAIDKKTEEKMFKEFEEINQKRKSEIKKYLDFATNNG